MGDRDVGPGFGIRTPGVSPLSFFLMCVSRCPHAFRAVGAGPGQGGP